MIKQAIEYIVGLGNTEIKHENGQVYATQPMQLLKKPVADAIPVRTLTSLVDYLHSKFDVEERLMVHVSSPTEVIVFGSLNDNENRSEYIKSTAMTPKFNFDTFFSSEEFIIKLQSAFVKNEDRDIVLKVVGSIQEEDVRTVGDDGVSQAVVAKTGIATVGNVMVPNPVLLAPFRTFVEINQPESEFIFRMQKGPRCALFEADGGAWKLEAMKRIKEFLQAALETEIEAGKIVIIA